MELSKIPGKIVSRILHGGNQQQGRYHGEWERQGFPQWEQWERQRRNQWETHKLPERIDGKSYLEVGCWEGLMCAEALRRGASSALGIDYCTSPDLTRAMREHGFQFVQMDIFSEKLLELPEFDLVHCAGVLYHVENPLSMMFRMRKLCVRGGALYIESSYAVAPKEAPVMVFHPGASFADNPSNWWSPSESCVHEMVIAAGFSEVETIRKTDPDTRKPYPLGRIVVRGKATSSPAHISQKVLPRIPALMPNAEGQGNRFGVKF
jgi:SAM-dependent methyltransferase